MISNLNKIFESDFIRISRFLIRKFGLNEAVLLSELYSEYNYWKEKSRLQQGGWFFSTIDNMNKNTGLTRHQQLTAVKNLRDYGVIQVKYHGMPKKRYFKFNSSVYNQLYEEFQLSVNSTDEELEEYEYYFDEECFDDEETCSEEQIVPKSKFEFSF
jgi:hypothetical protein